MSPFEFAFKAVLGYFAATIVIIIAIGSVIAVCAAIYTLCNRGK